MTCFGDSTAAVATELCRHEANRDRSLSEVLFFARRQVEDRDHRVQSHQTDARKKIL